MGAESGPLSDLKGFIIAIVVLVALMGAFTPLWAKGTTHYVNILFDTESQEIEDKYIPWHDFFVSDINQCLQNNQDAEDPCKCRLASDYINFNPNLGIVFMNKDKNEGDEVSVSYVYYFPTEVRSKTVKIDGNSCYYHPALSGDEKFAKRDLTLSIKDGQHMIGVPDKGGVKAVRPDYVIVGNNNYCFVVVEEAVPDDMRYCDQPSAGQSG